MELTLKVIKFDMENYICLLIGFFVCFSNHKGKKASKVQHGKQKSMVHKDIEYFRKLNMHNFYHLSLQYDIRKFIK